MLQYRHEWKHEISLGDRLAIRQRLSAIARPDSHAQNGRYLLRGLSSARPATKLCGRRWTG